MWEPICRTIFYGEVLDLQDSAPCTSIYGTLKEASLSLFWKGGRDIR